MKRIKETLIEGEVGKSGAEELHIHIKGRNQEGGE